MFRGYDRNAIPDHSSVQFHFEDGLTDEEQEYIMGKFRHYYFVTDREDNVSKLREA